MRTIKPKSICRNLEFAKEVKITLLSSSGGSVIVIVKEGRLCLDRTLAGKILVA